MKKVRRVASTLFIIAVLLVGFFADAAYRLSFPAASPATTPGTDTARLARGRTMTSLDSALLPLALKLDSFDRSLRSRPVSAEPLSILYGVQLLQYVLQWFNRGATRQLVESKAYFYLYQQPLAEDIPFFGDDILRFGPFPSGTPVNGFLEYRTWAQVFTPAAGRRLDKITWTYNYRPFNPELAFRMPRFEAEKERELASMETPGYFPIDNTSTDAVRGRLLNYEADLHMLGKGDQVVEDVIPLLLLPRGKWKAKILAEANMQQLVNERPEPPVLPNVPAGGQLSIIVREVGVPVQPKVTLEVALGATYFRVMDNEAVRVESRPRPLNNPGRLYYGVQPELAPKVTPVAELPLLGDGGQPFKAGDRYGYYDLTNWPAGKPFIITIMTNEAAVQHLKGGTKQ